MGSEAWELERRYSVPGNLDTRGLEPAGAPASEDLHAWSIYRQNLNSDFTDSALGSAEKSPLPYGNFQLRDSTVQSILRHPRYGPRSPLASNSYTYLKFGLPRVLPPSTSRGGGGRDAGSSGYDSSEEGRMRAAASGRQSAFACVPAMRSARSDPDFRNAMSAQGRETHSHIGLQHQPPHHQHMHHHPGMKPVTRESRMRSASEANLLQSGTSAVSATTMTSRAMTNRRHSIAPIDPGLVYDRHPAHMIHPQILQQQQLQQQFQQQQMQMQQTPQHPHLQLRGVEAAGRAVKNGPAYLRGISLEAGAGDVLAVMSTSEREGTLIMETISGRRRIRRGDILLNGRPVSARTLRSTVAYLSADTPEAGLSPELTALQCLSFYRLLRGAAGVSSLEAEAILQELGLDATKHCLVSSLTCSESRRLALACRLIEGTQILSLDRPTRGLDIFDAFFLVEYLRQWALRAQRLVLLTLHPPTYEILTMLSRVTLTSGGRVMYSGPRRDMLPYFALAEFPCPPFKNPSDYYLDLVTLDDLSAEAMLESSQRIDHLAELARARLPPLSDPGPPGPLPSSNEGANLFTQTYALFLRKLVYSQPWSLATLLRKIFIAASLSILLGAVFHDVSGDSNLYLKDRIGFHYASLGVLFWPISLLGMMEIIRCRPGIERDVGDGLYNRFVYIIVELVCTLPSWSLVYLSYLAPAFAMTGLHLGASPTTETLMPTDENLESLWRYLNVGLAYLLFQHFVCVLFARLCSNSWFFLALLLSGVVIGETTIGAGFTLHLDNLYPWYPWTSPLRWAFSLLLPPLHSPEVLGRLKNCKKQVHRLDIITQSACESPDGDLALREIGLSGGADAMFRDSWIWSCVGVLIATVILAFLLIRHSPAKSSLKSMPNKP
ncbi:ATP-binding cassette sub-family G member 8 [Nasonia vitripennis]|uniref:ABC transporter domain-containing protein n=1 Tax=Nasonia vitripennis TaxID=7425 RepID=A0A7M7QN43_NASVI|nr:ATP-binding cassette sub-family G member 8 [Nasonia vitripennis]XP_031789467.1 ATP-binding cassette sub-family G member 8 [Nasonia vitripennis]